MSTIIIIIIIIIVVFIIIIIIIRALTQHLCEVFEMKPSHNLTLATKVNKIWVDRLLT
jgi:Kef-type K+ transport system membrane component KefB